jgi:hypothetical protein
VLSQLSKGVKKAIVGESDRQLCEGEREYFDSFVVASGRSEEGKKEEAEQGSLK